MARSKPELGTRGRSARVMDPTLARFAELCRRASRDGIGSLDRLDLADLPRLYRYAATRLARVETSGRDPAAARALRAELARGHAILFEGLERDARPWPVRMLEFFLAECPRAIRAEWRPLAASFAFVYGLALVSYFAVAADLDLAWSLLDPGAVANEISQLQRTTDGQPFRGNFTFGLGESPMTAGWIMAHNMGVGVVFFASGLVLPFFVYVLAMNGLMLGTYTAVAAHWGRADEISSILWCHGTIEIQALVLAGAAGLVLVRGLLFPGSWTRVHALRLGARRSWRLLAPVFPLLFCAGLIEGFISPHAPFHVRIATAIGTGILLLAWIFLGGRERAPSR